MRTQLSRRRADKGVMRVRSHVPLVPLLTLGILLVAACSKTNPAVCCTTASDCAAVGLKDPKGCSDGLLCRGNQCIAETCATSADCDASAPYCASGSCEMMCMDDSQCPGFGQDTSDTFCVSGACVACRAGMNDCPTTAPVCDMGTCRACTADSDCASAVCDVDSGMCVAEDQIRYAGPSGNDANACTHAAPCTITKALNLVDAQHLWVRMLPGSYMPATVSIVNTNVKLVATGATLLNAGLSVGAQSDVDVRGLTVDASTQSVPITGIFCQPMNGAARLRLRAVRVQMNPNVSTAAALDSEALCNLQVSNSSFFGLTQFADQSSSVIDRSRFEGYWSVFANKANDSLTLHVTNSILVDPQLSPNLTPQVPGALSLYFAYDTLYTNKSTTILALCTGNGSGVAATSTVFFDNIFYAPNAFNAFAATSACTADTNVIYPEPPTVNSGTMAIVQDPKLVDPANGDFHLQAASPAIDAAKVTASDPPVDYDGTTRPQGTRDDIGAFEFK